LIAVVVVLQVQSQTPMKIDYWSICSIRNTSRTTLWQPPLPTSATTWKWRSTFHSESSLLW